MGRTDQVLTGGSLSYHQLTKAMKAVLALLLLVCLVVQISSAEQEDISDAASNEPNLSLQREVREAAKRCKSGGKECARSRKERRRKKKRKVVTSRKDKDTPKREKKFTRKSTRNKKGTKATKKKKTKKTKNNSKRQKTRTAKKQKKKGGRKNRGHKKGEKKEPLRTSSTSGNGRQDQCFTDMVAKTKKFNKAQVEFRLAKRIKSWGKLMKNKKSNSASTFNDALEAMNDATEKGKSCDGDSSSLAEAKKVREKLANCATTARDNCDEGKLSIPINSTLVSSCNATLGTFAKDFKECLTKSTDAEICTCVQGLTNPGSECLNFKAMHDGVKSQKEKCTKGSEEGSFGDCRKQERMAAKFGNKCKQSCPGGSVTTMAPARSQRMKLLRRLNQKLNFH